MVVHDDLAAVINGLEPSMRFDATMALAFDSATLIAVKGNNPADCAAEAVKYLGMARDLAAAHPEMQEEYRKSVYGIRDLAMGRAAQRMNANSGVLGKRDAHLLEGEEIKKGRAGDFSTAREIAGCAREALGVLLAYTA